MLKVQDQDRDLVYSALRVVIAVIDTESMEQQLPVPVDGAYIAPAIFIIPAHSLLLQMAD